MPDLKAIMESPDFRAASVPDRIAVLDAMVPDFHSIQGQDAQHEAYIQLETALLENRTTPQAEQAFATEQAKMGRTAQEALQPPVQGEYMPQLETSPLGDFPVGLRPRSSPNFTPSAQPPPSAASMESVQTPLVDPLSAGASATAASATMGLSAAQSLTAGATAALAELPIGVGTEAARHVDESLALPISVALGVLSASTFEKFLNRKIATVLTGAPADAVTNATSKIRQAIDEGRPKKADDLLDAAARTVRGEPPVPPPVKSSTTTTLEAARNTLRSKTKAFNRTADDLLQERFASKPPDPVQEATPRDVFPASDVPPSTPPETPTGRRVTQAMESKAAEAPPQEQSSEIRDLLRKFDEVAPTPEAIDTAQNARRALYQRMVTVKNQSGINLTDAARTLGISADQARNIIRSQHFETESINSRALAKELSDFNEQAKIVIPESEVIAETGTLIGPAGQGSRAALREAGKKPETYKFKFSEADIKKTQARIVALGQEIRAMAETARHDVQASNVERAVLENLRGTMNDAMKKAVAEANDIAKQFRKQRFAAGRAVKTFDRPPISHDIINAMEEAGVVLDGIKGIRERAPIYTNIIATAKKFINREDLTASEKTAMWRDLVDAWRLNLFSAFSFSLDAVGGASEATAQAIEAAGRDVAQLAKGHANLPNSMGIYRAIKQRFKSGFAPLSDTLESGFVAGAPAETSRTGAFDIRGLLKGDVVQGTFTTRKGLGSKIVDYAVGSPLYAKAGMDTAYRRMAAMARIYGDAYEEANRRGLRGLDRQNFVNDFLQNIPEDTVQRAITQSRKIGFNRQLTKPEETIASNLVTKLLIDPFMRWSFQFVRWGAEMLGGNPTLLKKVLITHDAHAEDVTGYLAKTAAGWGGLILLDRAIYDHVDFSTMTYVRDDGERIRLSSREPLPTALFVIALGKAAAATAFGDHDAATRNMFNAGEALKYTSIPGGRLMGTLASTSPQGGLVTNVLGSLSLASANAQVMPRALFQQITSTFNQMVPGQAWLSLVESITDPTVRQGFGANVPGLSQLSQPVIDPTTGKPLILKQRIPGFSHEFETIGGVTVPGLITVTNPVRNLLSRFGILVGRGLRAPVPGVPLRDVPTELQQDFTIAFGEELNRRLSPLNDALQKQLKTNPGLLSNPHVFDMWSKRIGLQTSKAAQAARRKLMIRAPRQKGPSARELKLPRAMQPNRAPQNPIFYRKQAQP